MTLKIAPPLFLLSYSLLQLLNVLLDSLLTLVINSLLCVRVGQSPLEELQCLDHVPGQLKVSHRILVQQLPGIHTLVNVQQVLGLLWLLRLTVVHVGCLTVSIQAKALTQLK